LSAPLRARMDSATFSNIRGSAGPAPRSDQRNGFRSCFKRPRRLGLLLAKGAPKRPPNRGPSYRSSEAGYRNQQGVAVADLRLRSNQDRFALIRARGMRLHRRDDGPYFDRVYSASGGGRSPQFSSATVFSSFALLREIVPTVSLGCFADTSMQGRKTR
jgi:hypothetical protein